jgi:hypothetical protein
LLLGIRDTVRHIRRQRKPFVFSLRSIKSHRGKTDTMLQKYERPMTEEERARLAEWHTSSAFIPTPRQLWSGMGTPLVALIMLALFFCALGRLIGFSGNVPVWRVVLATIVAGVPMVACVIGALILIFVYMGLYRANTWLRANFGQVVEQQTLIAVGDGRVSVCQVSAVGAIVIGDSEYGFGTILIYDLGDGTSFWLCEADIRDSADGSLNDRLPQKFEIVRTSTDGIFINLANCEGKLEPELRIRDTDLPEDFFESGDSPESESVLPGRPREVLARLGYQEHGPSTGA